MAYKLEGRMLEVCTCNVICPCWVGGDPDGGICDGLMAWHMDKGTVDGLDVSGLTLAVLVHIPGNALKGNWRAVVFVDQRATPEQQEALLNVWTGKLGGPVADLAQLIGEVGAVERADIAFEVQEGKGTLQIGQSVRAELAPLLGATGQPTTLLDPVIPVIPGSPVYLGRASSVRANAPNHGFDIDIQGHSAAQGSFRFEG